MYSPRGHWGAWPFVFVTGTHCFINHLGFLSMFALHLESVGQDEYDPEALSCSWQKAWAIHCRTLHPVPDRRHESSTVVPKNRGHKPILTIFKRGNKRMILVNTYGSIFPPMTRKKAVRLGKKEGDPTVWDWWTQQTPFTSRSKWQLRVPTYLRHWQPVGMTNHQPDGP